MRAAFRLSAPGSMLVEGTRTSSSERLLVLEAPSGHMPCVGPDLNPGRSVSMRNPRTLSAPPSPAPSSFAHTTATSAIDPEVIHIFSPFKMYSSPALRARVVMPAGFDPKPDSVNPKQPSFSPVAKAGSHVFFCSSVPKVRMGYITSADCTLTKLRKPESPRSSSCNTRPYSTFDMPAQP